MSDRLWVSRIQIDGMLEAADDLDQWAEDADGFEQTVFANKARTAAEDIRRVLSRFERVDDTYMAAR